MTNATLLFIIIMNKYGLRTVILKELEMIRKIKGFFSSIGKPKALLALAILLCTAGVIALFVYDSVQNKNEAQTRAEFEERIRDLSVEKLELTAELDALGGRFALHSALISLVQPITGKRIELSEPLPAELSALLHE